MNTNWKQLSGRILSAPGRFIPFRKRKTVLQLVIFASTCFGPITAQTYEFTNAGATGQNGPSQSQVNSEYSSTNLDGKVIVVNGIQYWVVPQTGTYRIEATGAQGYGTYGGRGAYMSGDFLLNAGDTLKILVGQKGAPPVGSGTNQFGGGGGSFVTFTNNTPIIIAGGGGGSWATSHNSTTDASTGTSGNSGANGPAGNGAGGTNGNGGTDASNASGGGGLLTDGGNSAGGKAFINGGQGGRATSSGGEGGFGGGGGASSFDNRRSGGGGGYSGGGGSAASNSTTGEPEGGGGGSYNSGAMQTNTASVGYGHGVVKITILSTGAQNDIGVISIDSPTVFCAGTHDVVVSIQNFGKNIVDSVRLNWTVNGTPQSTVYFQGTIDTLYGSGASVKQVNLGAYTFSSTAHTIQVWSSMPNGQTDTSNTNDSITRIKQANLPAPTGIAASSVSTTGATLSWNPGSTSNTWAYVNSTSSATPTGPGTIVSADSVVLSGLVRATTYYFFVREICPTGDSSQWAGPFDYQTDCSSPLSGTYSVDPGQAPSNSNFASLTDALTALYTCTISGAVTFNVAANTGPFTGGVELTNINGASATNTITLNGNGNVVNESSAGYFLALNGVSYLTINDFEFINTDPTVPKFGIMVRGASHHISITNNVLNVGTEYTSTSGAGIVVSNSTTSATTAGDNGQYITITGNEIIGGYYGITLVGQSSYADNYGHLVANNIIRDYYLYGVYMVNADSVRVENNDLSRSNRTTVSTFYGTYMSSCRNMKIIKNSIHSSGAGSYTAYPVYITTSVNSAGYETEIINNKIYDIPTTSTLYAIYGLGTRDHIKVYHNTIDLVTEGTGAKRAVFFSTAPDNHELKNNILSVRGDGTGTKYCIYITTNSTSFTSDNNVLYMGATAGTNYTGFWSANQATLADWQTNSSQDANSVDDNPQFAQPSSGYLIPLTTLVDNIGTPVGISTDITGASRSSSTPDAGAYEFTGLNGDVGLVSGELFHNNICYNTSDTAEFIVSNPFGAIVDFSVDSVELVWNVTGPVNSNGSVIINNDTMGPGSSKSVKVYSVDMSKPGTYALNAYIKPNAANLSAFNDTLATPFEFTVQSILSVVPKLTELDAYGDSVELMARSPIFPAGQFMITEVCHFKTANGAPSGGWPSYLVADDYIEITGVPNSDLSGVTLEQWNTSSMVSSYTFPSGTVLSPNGTAVIAVGQMGSSTESPSDYYYHGNGSYTGSFGSTTTAGRILKNANGVIIDAVVYGNYTFPGAAGVTSSDWSGTTPSVSSSGNRLMGAYTKDATNWVNSGTAGGSPLQDPNTVNSGVTVPQSSVTGLTWKHNSVVIDTVTNTIAGPYTTHGTYEYIATYTNVCGTFYDTATVVVPPIIDLAANLVLPSSITCGNDMPVEVTISNVSTEDLDFDIDNATVTVTVSGQATQTFTLVLDDNSLNSNQPLAKGTDMTVSLGNLNIDATGTYYLQASVSVANDLDASNDMDAMDSVVLHSIADAGPDYQVCSGSGTQIGGTPTAIGGSAPYTYAWTPSNLLANATLANPTATVSSNSWLTVKVTDNLGCYSYDSMLVEALSTPSPSVSGDTVVCAGISMYSTPFNAGTTYQWSVTNGTIIGSDTGETVNVQWSQSGSGSVKVKQTITAGGCFATTPDYSVTINPNPSITFTATGATTFCDGNSVTLLTIPQSGNSYEWRLNGSTLSGATSNILTATAGGDYKVVVTNSNGCTDSSSAITVTVNALPSASITPAGSTTFCSGDSVILDANTGTGLSYQWMMNGSAINGATGASYGATQQGNYTVVVSDANGCSASSSQQSVTVNALPTASIVAMGATTFCQGEDVTLSAVPVSGASYQWILDGSNISGATSANYVASAGGTYSVRVTSSASCAAVSNTIQVTVNSLPSATITPAGATTFCSGSSVDLDANTGSGLSYQWMLNNSAINGATSASYTASAQGNYTVEVTNAQNCKAVSAAEPVVVNPMPTASIIAMGPVTFCQGENVTLSAIPVSGATYEWRSNGGPIAGATSSTYQASTSGNYTVRVTSAANCSDVSNSITVTVNSMPTASITPSGPTTFCDGSSVDLVASAATGTTLQWFNNGLPIAGASSGTYTADQSGMYTVSVTSAQGCKATSAPVTVTVNPMPMAIIIFTGPTAICQGENTILVGLSQSGYSYQWLLDGNVIPGATSNTYHADQSGNYSLQVSSAANCVATSTPVSIVVSPLPSAIITPAGPTTVCTGNQVVLDANTGTGLSYQWYHNGNLIPNAISASYTAVISGNYTVRVTSSAGCEETSSITAVTINPTPTASVSPQGTTSICDGSALVLQAATASNGSYQWMKDGTAISGANALSYSATTSGDYTVVVSDVVSGCVSESSPVTVEVSPMPTALFQAPDVCLGSDMAFTNESSVSNGTLSYAWDFDDGNTSAVENPSHTYAAAGTYQVSLTVTSDLGINCSAVYSADVTVRPTPSGVFTWGHMGNGLVDFAADDTSGVSYRWDLGDGDSSADKHLQHMYASGGTYTVSLLVTNAEGCDAATTQTVTFDPTGLQSGDPDELSFNVYPNPFSAETKISYQLIAGSEVKLEVYDQLGRLVQTISAGRQEAGSYVQVLNANDLAPQALFIRLTVDGRVYTQKVILIH